MPTGDEGDLSPMLSQPRADNSPMISGRGTKIFVTMRGAYVAGNLDRLVEGMETDEQITVFKQALIRQIIWAGNLSLDGVDESATAYSQFTAVSEWLADPSPANQQKVSTLYYNLPVYEPEGIYYTVLETAFRFMGRIIITDSLRMAADAANFCTNTLLGRSRRGIFTHNPNIHQEAYQWRIDVAWALLRDAELPPLPEIIE